MPVAWISPENMLRSYTNRRSKASREPLMLRFLTRGLDLLGHPNLTETDLDHHFSSMDNSDRG